MELVVPQRVYEQDLKKPLRARGLPIWQADKTPGFLGGWLAVFLTFEVEGQRSWETA